MATRHGVENTARQGHWKGIGQDLCWFLMILSIVNSFVMLHVFHSSWRELFQICKLFDDHHEGWVHWTALLFNARSLCFTVAARREDGGDPELAHAERRLRLATWCGETDHGWSIHSRSVSPAHWSQDYGRECLDLRAGGGWVETQWKCMEFIWIYAKWLQEGLPLGASATSVLFSSRSLQSPFCCEIRDAGNLCSLFRL